MVSRESDGMRVNETHEKGLSSSHSNVEKATEGTKEAKSRSARRVNRTKREERSDEPFFHLLLLFLASIERVDSSFHCRKRTTTRVSRKIERRSRRLNASSPQGTKTTGHSRPLAACTVEMTTF